MTVRERWAGLLIHTLDPTDQGRSTGPGEVLALEALERKVEAAPTWPVDLPILGKLGVMALTIIVALITQVIGNLLGL